MTPLSKEQALLLSAYTGHNLASVESDLHSFLERVLNRKVVEQELNTKALLNELQTVLQPEVVSLIPDPWTTTKKDMEVRIKSAGEGRFALTVEGEVADQSTVFEAIETTRTFGGIATLTMGDSHRSVITIKDEVTFWAMVFAHNVPVVYVSSSEAKKHQELAA